MARTDTSIWFNLGQALERASAHLPGRSENGDDSLSARLRERVERPRLSAPVSGLLVGAAGTILSGAISSWLGKRAPSVGKLARGAAAGAGAAGAVLALRSLLDEEEPIELVDELLAGAGKGVVYAAILDPLLPGPPAVRGALAGTAEYMAAPWGGLFSSLQSLSPARKIPVVSVLLEAGDAEEDPYLSFLLYGVALGLLYGHTGDD